MASITRPDFKQGLCLLLVAVGVISFVRPVWAETIVQSTVCQANSVLRVEKPLNNARIRASAVEVVGQATAGSSLFIAVNGQRSDPVVVSSTGQFNVQVPLNGGSNRLVVTTNLCGQIKTAPVVTVQRGPAWQTFYKLWWFWVVLLLLGLLYLATHWHLKRRRAQR